MHTDPSVGAHGDEPATLPTYRFSPLFEPDAGKKMRVGFVLLSTDQGTEREPRHLFLPRPAFS